MEGWWGHTKSFLLSEWNVKKFLERGELMKFDVVFDVWKVIILWRKKKLFARRISLKSLGVVL